MPDPISIKWYWISLETKDTWKVVLKKLIDRGVNEKNLSRSVYAIRISARFGINYPDGVSPVLYVGEGHLKQRVMAHRTWLRALEKAFGDVKLQLAVATPRVKNNEVAYKETEAALIQFFKKKYGCIPFKNSHEEGDNDSPKKFTKESLSEALTPGKGTRYHWAIEPTKINPFYDVYMTG